jgi:protein-L-isoaspartate(D-aspartate) O-methyltransferase
MASTASDTTTRALRDHLVEHLSADGRIESAAVAQAFRVVPRHVFLPDIDPAVVYTDEAFPTKRGQHGIPVSSSSQPAIMAVMLEQLGVEPGHHILEIGAGTGYNAALLDRLVGPTGSVTTIDIDEDLVVSAREHLAAARASRVEVVHGDGGLGWPDRAPYDRIIVTVGAWDIPSAWAEQLAPHGRLVLPLSLRTVLPSVSVAFEPVADHLASVSIRPCGFMPMRGAFARPQTIVALDADAGLFLDVAEPRDIDTAALCTAVHNGGKDIPSGVQAIREDLRGLGLWLTLHEPDMCLLAAGGAAADQRLVPALIALPGVAVTTALLGHRSMAALVRLDGDGSERFELGVRPLGDNATPLAQRLLERIRGWEAQRRPSASRLNINAYPLRETSIPAGATIIDKSSRRLALTWQPATSSAGDSPRPHGQ